MNQPRSPIDSFAEGVDRDGFTQAVLLGMGGSSLAPEVFSKIFGGPGASSPALELVIIDSTDPDMIRGRTDHLDLTKTLFIVATKSGGTVETLSAFKYFYNRVSDVTEPTRAGAHFIAITDPDSGLTDVASKYGFRRTFSNDPNIGGRYSALSYFGLVPAALVGVDLARLLDRASKMVGRVSAGDDTAGHAISATRLGAAIGELVKVGRDKLTFVISPSIAGFGDWVEQLIAESTGKDGTGILPVVGEPLGPPAVYGADRVFVHLSLAGDTTNDAGLTALVHAGHPVISLPLEDPYDLGGQFFFWEMVTAVASNRLGIHPFDQPNVEAAKVLAKKMVARYLEEGQLPTDEASPPTAEALTRFLETAVHGDYVAIQAYVPPTPSTDKALERLRVAIRDRRKLATTTGYGPRFLHSTGQLHKGDRGNGLFIQLIRNPVHDFPIPGEAGDDRSTMSFAVLEAAQALGDARALRDIGRRLIRFRLDAEVEPGLTLLADGF
jgi:glucose-6-phosphate isomerase